MLGILKSVLFSILLLVVSANFAFAAVLELVQIGALATNGMQYSEWWYTNENPVLSGATDPGETVVVEINSAAESVVADTGGAWSYSPTTLTNGDHNVVLSAGDQQYAFTLHIGTEVPASGGTTSTPAPSATAAPSGTGTPSATPASLPDDLPVSGATEVTLALLAGAGLLIFVGYRFVKR